MKIQVKAPASSANLGSGTDCLGIALPLYLTASIEAAKETKISLPKDAPPIPSEQNLLFAAMRKVFRMAGEEMPPFSIKIRSDVPFARGLGSSACAIVAGIWGANAFLARPLSQRQLLSAAVEIEGHPDNVVPCAMGGFTVAMPTASGVEYRKTPVDKKLKLIAAVPDYELATNRARAVLPGEVPLSDSLFQIQRACYLVSIFGSGNFEDLNDATQDRLFTPARRALIPGFDEVVDAAGQAGAQCVTISGAGPTLLAMTTSTKAVADAIADAMREAFAKVGVTSATHVFHADNNGVVVRKEEKR